jgi:Lrp/AsnC family transcriptional regulator for asnA, asnC and gidA
MDATDKKIVTILQKDGRATLNDIAKNVGLSSMGTKKRLDKLQKDQTIKIAALLNPNALKLYPALVMLEMESAEAMHDLLKRFEKCPRVVQIFKTMGGFNLVALVVAENPETLESISTEKCSLRCSKGIRRSEFYPVSETFFSPFLQIREGLSNKQKKAPCNVDCAPCDRFDAKKCVGCPTTVNYRGTL